MSTETKRILASRSSYPALGPTVTVTAFYAEVPDSGLTVHHYSEPVEETATVQSAVAVKLIGLLPPSEVKFNPEAASPVMVMEATGFGGVGGGVGLSGAGSSSPPPHDITDNASATNRHFAKKRFFINVNFN